MKLRDDYLVYLRNEQSILVPVGKQGFNGVVKINKTAAAIIGYLKEKTTEQEIIQKMLAEYDASEEQITADVRKVLNELNRIGAIEE